jgi:hypothetical protein
MLSLTGYQGNASQNRTRLDFAPIGWIEFFKKIITSISEDIRKLEVSDF